MITNKDEAKALTEHISCDFKSKINSAAYNSKQKLNKKTCQCECKNDDNWNPSTCIYKNIKHLKSVADSSVTECDEIVIVKDIVSTKETNTIATKKTNVTSTTSLNYHSKK